MSFCECGCGRTTKIARQSSTKRGWIKGQPLRFIKGHNAKAEKNPNWHGGSTIVSNRYPGTWHPEHAHANRNGYVSNHVLAATRALGKPLPSHAVVHHHDAALVICQDQAYHMLIHRRTRALRACGHADWLKCPICKAYDDPSNLKVWKSEDNKKSFGVHARCKESYMHTWHLQNRRIQLI